MTTADGPLPPQQPGEPTGEYWSRCFQAVVDDPPPGLDDELLTFLAWQARFCRRHDVRPGMGDTADLWGYGSVPVWFADDTGEFWTPDVFLVEPTGLSITELRDIAEEMFTEDEADRREHGDDAGWRVDRDGTRPDRWLFHDRGIVLLFMSHSPWAAEWFAAVRPLFDHALAKSGLLDKLDDLATYRTGTDEHGEQVAFPTGDTFGAMVRRRAVPEDEAREQAFRGPGLGGDR